MTLQARSTPITGADNSVSLNDIVSDRFKGYMVLTGHWCHCISLDSKITFFPSNNVPALHTGGYDNLL